MNETQMMFDRRTRRWRPVHSHAPLASSSGLGWHGFRLEHRKVPAFEFEDVVGQVHAIACHLHQPMQYRWRDHRGETIKSVQPGTLTLVPAHLPHSSAGLQPGEVALLIIDPSALHLPSHRLGRSGEPELKAIQGVTDPLLSGVLMALLAEIQAGAPSGRLYAESLLETFSLHLVRRYGTDPLHVRNSEAPAIRHEMRRALDFIHDRLVEDFSLKELADSVGLSPFHFSRMFKAAVGLPPYRYVLQKRIERAKEMLVGGQSSLSEVAGACGFCDQSHFSNHFKRLCGLTPREFINRSQARRPAPDEVDAQS